jgi:hypothetical protein
MGKKGFERQREESTWHIRGQRRSRKDASAEKSFGTCADDLRRHGTCGSAAG